MAAAITPSTDVTQVNGDHRTTSSVTGEVISKPSDRGVPGLLVTAYALTGNVGRSKGRRQRLGSVLTDGRGSFRVEHNYGVVASNPEATLRWDLLVTVETVTDRANAKEVRPTLLASELREDASPLETFRFVISDARLKAAGVVFPPTQRPEDLIARDRAARDVQKKFEDEKLRRLGENLRQAQALREKDAEGFKSFFRRLSSANRERKDGRDGFLPPGSDIVKENLNVIRRTITEDCLELLRLIAP